MKKKNLDIAAEEFEFPDITDKPLFEIIKEIKRKKSTKAFIKSMVELEKIKS